MTADLKDVTLQEIAEIRSIFESAAQRLAEGEMVDMSGVDARVARLCQTVQNAPEEMQKVFLPELSTLVELLNGYEKDLRRFHTALQASEESAPAQAPEGENGNTNGDQHGDG